MNTLLYIEAITDAIPLKRFSILSQRLGSLLGMFVPMCLSFCEVICLHYKHHHTVIAVVPKQVSLGMGNNIAD